MTPLSLLAGRTVEESQVCHESNQQVTTFFKLLEQLGSIVVYLLFNELLIDCVDLLCITLCPFWFCNHFEEE